MKKILLALLFTFSLFAGESEKIVPISKHQTVIEDCIGVSKFKINAKQMGLILYGNGLTGEPRRYSSDYVSHISATIDNISVFDAALSPCVSGENYLSFSFKSFTNSDDITFNVTDNHGKTREQSFKMIKKGIQKTNNILDKQNTVSSVVINPQAWEAVTIDEAIREVYGSTKIDQITSRETSRMDLDAELNCIGSNNECIIFEYMPVKVRIESKMDLKSIAIFSSATAKPLVAFIQLPGHNIIDIVLPIKFEKNGTLFFVVEGRDKKLYRSSQHIVTTGAHVEEPDIAHSNMHYILEDNLVIKKDR